MKWNCDTELSEIRKIYPRNMQYQGLMLHTDTCVYKYQNLALEEQHRDIRFERKGDCISVDEHACTCHG